MKTWHILAFLPLWLCASCASKPHLAWRVVDLRPHEYFAVMNEMQDCWRVDIEVTNQTSRGIYFKWPRDETAFQLDGRWESLGISALIPYMPPYESRTFALFLPKRAEAYRYSMYYQLGCAVYDRPFMIEGKLTR
jgi:hypothetical protein